MTQLPAGTLLSTPVVHSQPGTLGLGAPVSLTWTTVTGAKDYLVYRISMSTSLTTPPPSASALATACSSQANAAICSQLPDAQAGSSPIFGYPGTPELMTRATSPAYSESAPSSLQSLYFVRAEDSNGNLSAPSNVVGGPSLATQ